MVENSKARFLNGITHQVIGTAIAVHQELGPGLLESAYETCLAFELAERELQVERQKALPVHQAQIISYLRLSGCAVGLLMSFNVKLMKNGIRKVVNDFPQ